MHEHIIPRPVDSLPEYANSPSRKKAADRLSINFKMDEDASLALASSVVDPAQFRKGIDNPVKLAVPGGRLLAIRVDIWARRTLPDIRNPRIGNERRHPFAVDPGTDEESRFAPVGDPSSEGSSPVLDVSIESAEHMEWSAAKAARTVLGSNDWRYSIRSQGVLTEVWVAMTRYTHADGTPDLLAPTTVEGSSRLTASHDILELGNSAESVARVDDRSFRSSIRNLNEALDRGPSSKEEARARCEIVPALVIVGYESFQDDNATFASAIRSLVALRHVDAPKSWGEGSELEHLADEVLAELRSRGIITEMKCKWLAGGITREGARAAHLSDDPAIRAADIVSLFTSSDPGVRDAIRAAVTRQSTRKRITSKFKSKLATALIVRSVGGEGSHIERVRKYLQHGFGDAVRDTPWTATQKNPDLLLDEALKEFDNDPEADPSHARLELAARSTYSLVSTLSLWADRGTANNPQPDRRAPGQVIDAMMRDRHGLVQLHRALIDVGSGERKVARVDPEGAVLRSDDHAQDTFVNDVYLRSTWSQDGNISRPETMHTPDDRLQSALAELGGTVEAMLHALHAVRSVKGLDGTSHVEGVGINARHAKDWRTIIGEADEELTVWKRIWSNKNTNAENVAPADDDWNDGEMADDLDSQEREWEDELLEGDQE